MKTSIIEFEIAETAAHPDSRRKCHQGNALYFGLAWNDGSIASLPWQAYDDVIPHEWKSIVPRFRMSATSAQRGGGVE